MMDVGTDVEVEEVDTEDRAGIFGVEGTALLIFMADLSDLSSCILLNISSSDSGRGAVEQRPYLEHMAEAHLQRQCPRRACM